MSNQVAIKISNMTLKDAGLIKNLPISVLMFDCDGMITVVTDKKHVGHVLSELEILLGISYTKLHVTV